MFPRGTSLIVKKSRIQGKGVFAGRDFKKGEKICFFSGKKVSIPQIKKLSQDRKQLSCDALQIGARQYLIIDKPYVYINHSCRPNSNFQKDRTLVAMRPIHKGEEIFYDYATTEWTPQDYAEYNKNIWPVRCRCGTSRCRKVIGCFPYIPAAIRGRYLKQGFVQKYILQKSRLSLEKQRCFVCEKIRQESGLSCKISNV